MKEILEGSHAVAEIVRLCNPGVISAYPITPQTHIVEKLAELHANGKWKGEYVRAESEFAAASIILGAQATGVRSYTATTSQGLILMAEVLFNIAGMRLPIVLTCANRALSAPINIWNDQQDSVTMRDSGWLMLYAEDVQEACDMHLIAFRVAEEMNLPVMVNMDGYILTHTYEPVDLPSKLQVNKFVPAYKPEEYLDPKNPKTFGAFAPPESYMEIREDLHKQVMNSKSNLIRAFKDFKKTFKRGNGELIEEYKAKDAEILIVSMGSVLGTAKEVVDELRKKGKKVGIVKIKALRPFPKDEVIKALAKAKHVAVLDKSISLGEQGVFAGDLKQAVYGRLNNHIQSFIVGLGGRDVTPDMLNNIVEEVGKGKDETVFVGRN